MYTHEIGRMLGRPHGAADTGPTGWAAVAERIARQERGEVSAHTDRADPGAAAAVRDAERLVQVEVADVGAESPGSAEPDQRVQVGAVHVHLAAVLVDHVADVLIASSNTPWVDG